MIGRPGSSAPLTTRHLLADANVAALARLAAGEAGLDRWLTHPRIQKSGLGLAGHMHGIVPSRVQIFGETEISYLESLPLETRRIRLLGMFGLGLSCVVVTRGVGPLEELIEAAASTDTPLVVMEPRSSATIAILHEALDELLAPRASVLGVAVEVFGVGMLLEGPSGIGKSESALFLVERGHRLVADDRVELVRRPSRGVRASPPATQRDRLEVRGLGSLDIRALFGATAVRDEVDLELVVELRRAHDAEEDHDRLGREPATKDILGANLPLVRLAVRPGRDMGVLLEVAARNQLRTRAASRSGRASLREAGAAEGRLGPAQPAEARPAGARPAEAGPTKGRAAEDRAASGQPTDDQLAGGQPADDQLAGGQPADGQLAGSNTNGNV